MAAPSEPKRNQGVSQNTKKSAQKLYQSLTRGVSKPCFSKSMVFIRSNSVFRCCLRSVFLALGSMSGSPKGTLGRAQRHQEGRSEISGGARGPKRAPNALQGGAWRGPRAPNNCKSKNMKPKSQFQKTVKIRWFLFVSAEVL